MRTSMDSTTYVHFDFRTFRISFFVEAEINTKMSYVFTSLFVVNFEYDVLIWL